MQLADDDALGSVDDEFAAADHDRHVAEVDLFFDRLLFLEAQPDPERAPVSQPQLAAFVGGIARLAELVLDVIEPVLPVVALDREDFAQNAFEPIVLAALRRRIALKEPRKRHGLNLGEIFEIEILLNGAEVPDGFGFQNALSWNRHRCSLSSKTG